METQSNSIRPLHTTIKKKSQSKISSDPMGASVRRSKCGRLRGRRRGKCEREKQNKTKEQRTANEARWKMRRKRGAVTEERPENNEMMEKERSREKCCATLKWININMLSWWWMRPAISRPSTGHHESLHPFPSLSPFLALPAVHSSLSLSLSLSLYFSLCLSHLSLLAGHRCPAVSFFPAAAIHFRN